MADDAAVLLPRPRQVTRDVDEGEDRQVEAVAEADEARGLVGGVDVEAPREHGRLVGDDADGLAVHPGEAGDHVHAVEGLALVDLTVVDDELDDPLDVVGPVAGLGDKRVELLLHAVRRVRAGGHRGLLSVVQGEVAQELLDLVDAVLVGGRHEVGHAALGVVRHGAAELHGGHLLAHDGLDDLGARDEHLGVFLVHHVDEVHERGRVDGASGRGSHDGAHLRDDARGHSVAVEDPAVARQRVDGLLDPRAARVVEAHDGGARRHGALLALDDLGGVHLAKRPSHGAEVLREGKDGPAVDHAVPRHDALAGDFRLVHAEVYAAVLHKLVQLHEGPLVEETGQPLAGRQPPRGLHLLEGLGAAAELDLLLAGPHEIDFFFICHGLSPSGV